jgi:hypothetical protein
MLRQLEDRRWPAAEPGVGGGNSPAGEGGGAGAKLAAVEQTAEIRAVLRAMEQAGAKKKRPR